MPTIVRKKKATRDQPQQSTSNGAAAPTSLQQQAEQVNAAVDSLECGVKRRLSQYQANHRNTAETTDASIAKRTKAIDKVLQHVRHCWTHLRHNLVILSAGMQCFMQQLLPSFHSHLVALCHQQGQTKASNRNNNNAVDMANQVVQALQHLFQSLLRLHDGYILTVSGECRHAADVVTAKKSRYPSHLNLLNANANTEDTAASSVTGTTYATHNTYLGASWDEWFDPHHGLRHRLHTLLRPFLPSRLKVNVESFWDEWSDCGRPGAALEAIIADTELQMKAIQLQFTELTRESKFTKVLQQALQAVNQRRGDDSTVAAKVTLDWKDKMEQLIVIATVTGNNGKIKLERYANNFQVQSGTSVLPSSYTTPQVWATQGGMQWNRVEASVSDKNNVKMAKDVGSTQVIKGMPAPAKRRRVVVDSDDEVAVTDAKMDIAPTNRVTDKKLPPTCTTVSTAVTTGLVVKVLESNVHSTQEAPLQSSVHDIKLQCGANVESMEAAFDNLQVEEEDAVREAELIDNAAEDALSETLEDMAQAETRVRQCKRAFRRVLEDVSYTDLDEANNAIWNARNDLREAMMHTGQLYLWSDRTVPEQGDRTASALAERANMLHKAIQYFEKSSRLVVAQQRLHVDMRQYYKSAEDARRARFYRRNLLLISGQAQTNIGIANIELVRRSPWGGTLNRKQRLQLSCRALDDAIESARAMKSVAVEDLSSEGSCDPLQARVDLCAAMQLESLSLRWKATALWYLHQLPEAYAVFFDASSVYAANAKVAMFKSSTQPEESDAVVECRVECYHAMTSLADLAMAALKQATVLQMRESPAEYEVLLDFVDQAIAKAASDSTAIQEEHKVSIQFLQAKEIMPSEELLKYWSEVQAWWEEKRATSCRNILADAENTSFGLTRSDLPTSFGLQGNETRPTQRFLIEPQPRRRSKYNLGGSAGFSNIGNSVHNDEHSPQQPQQTTRQYRKWCEDTILDKATGRMVPHLVYPSIAPEMPPHIRAIFERKNQSR